MEREIQWHGRAARDFQIKNTGEPPVPRRGINMSDELTKLDPAWAWSHFKPDAEHPWSRRLSAHLYRRAAFGADSATLDDAVKAGVDGAVARLCQPPAPSAEFEKTIGTLADRVATSGNKQQLGAWWLYRIRNSADPLTEKLTLFWHGHFATSAKKVDKTGMMLDQNALLRQKGAGKFQEMVKAVSRDLAMLIYLDSTTNRRIHPNENYGRELMELFCLGVGNYTEKDVKEVARAFTGWEVISDRFQFNAPQHDTDNKTFLGQTGNFDGDDAIRIILDQPAAANFIARKLMRYFVFDEPAAPDALVEPIAKELRENGFHIGITLRRMLGSNLFFSEYAVGRKVRSPVELGMGLLVSLGATTNLVSLNQATAELGQGLFFPPNVKGWDGGRAWINSSTLLGRANLVAQILTAGETNFDHAGGSLAAAADRAGARSPAETVDWLLELLVAVPVPKEAREALLSLAGGPGTPEDRSTRIVNVIRTIGTLPEFQLG
jgi:uncharacterized protein (DUF1800 family)